MTLPSQTAPILSLQNIRKEYVLRQSLIERARKGVRRVAAVDGVSLAVARGTIFGLVGESGSGKSTVAQIMVGLLRPTSGTIAFAGQDNAPFARRERHRVQMVFQDSASSLNPRKRIRRTLAEALHARGEGGDPAELMAKVGLDAPLLGRLPHELSGGQRQRVGIARALAMQPELLVADEPVSSLDVSLQGQIINLLHALNRELGLTLVLISHDLAVVARLCDEIAVMQTGRVVEQGAPADVLTAPAHPYTQALLAAVPRQPALHTAQRGTR